MLFQLAQSSLELGQNERANELFHQLISEFKQSSYLEEAYLQLGDSAFEKGQFGQALGYLETLISNPKSPLWLYAHYKSGWANYNLNQLGLALNHFKIIVEQEDLDGSTQHSLALKKKRLGTFAFP